MPFLVQMIPLKDSDHVTAQASVQVSDQVQRLISVMEQGEYSSAELMQLLGLTHRATFQKNYLNTAIELGLIELHHSRKTEKPKAKV